MAEIPSGLVSDSHGPWKGKGSQTQNSIYRMCACLWKRGHVTRWVLTSFGERSISLFKCLIVTAFKELKTAILLIKNSRFAARIGGINPSRSFENRLGSAFMTLRWFKLSHIYVQITSLHKGDGFEYISKFFKWEIDFTQHCASSVLKSYSNRMKTIIRERRIF